MDISLHLIVYLFKIFIISILFLVVFLELWITYNIIARICHYPQKEIHPLAIYSVYLHSLKIKSPTA